MTDEEPGDDPPAGAAQEGGPPESADGSQSGGPPDDLEPSAEAIVETASEAAEGLILSRYKQSDVADMDVTVRFEDGTLDVDVYLNAPEEPDPAEVAQEAVEAAEAAVDELFEAA